MAGVLIALGANSWWESREDRRLERAYLEQLRSDLHETEAHLQAAIGGDSTMLADLDAALASPASAAGSGMGYTQFRPVDGTYSAMIQNGDLRLLQNDSLRFGLIRYAAASEATGDLLAHTEELIWGLTERIIERRIVHSSSSAAGSGDDGLGASLLRDPVFRTALVSHQLATENRLRNLRRLHAQTLEVQRLLDAELARR